MPLPTAQEVASKYLYGTDTPPEIFDDPALIRPVGAYSSIPVAKSDYFDPVTGPGRFALGSEFDIVDNFFTTKDYWVAQMNAPAGGVFAQFYQPGDPELRLTKQQFAESILGMSSYGLNVTNRNLADGFDDYAERTFIWNGTQFSLGVPGELGDPPLALGEGPDFVFRLDGEFTIENFSIEPRRNDNFDFDGSDFFTGFANAKLEHAMDPSGIGRIVNLEFIGEARPTSTYTLADFQADQSTAASWTNPSFPTLLDGINEITSDLFSSGVTATLVDGKPVIYGSDDADAIIEGTDIVGHYDLADSGDLTLWGMVDFYLHEYVDNGIIYITGGGDDNIQGTNFDDDFQTGIGQDIIEANAGNDWIDGGADGDTIDGGDGTDVLHFDKTGAGVTVDLVAGTGLGGDAEGDTYSNIEVVIGTDSVDTFTATQMQRVAGGDGADQFYYSDTDIPGPMVVWGGEGADVIYFDRYTSIAVVEIPNLTEETFANFGFKDFQLEGKLDWDAIDLVIVNPDGGDRLHRVYTDTDTGVYTDTVISVQASPALEQWQTGWTIGDNVESAVTSWDTVLYPSDKASDVGFVQIGYTFDSGHEILFPWWHMAGGAIVGSSIVSDALGTKFMAQIGGKGAEHFDASSSGSDRVGYSSSKSGIALDLGLGMGTKGDAKGDTYIGIKNIGGSEFADMIKGNASANQLTGNAGDDTLSGEAGDDILNGGAGDDTIIGGNGNDIIVYSGGHDTIAGRFSNYGNDTLDLGQYTTTQVSFVNVGNDIVITTPDGTITLSDQIRWDVGHGQSNIENISFADGGLDEAGIRARAIADQSTAGDDAIVATKFDDTIVYSGGNDILTGGLGADIFEFNFGSGNDVVTDFTDGADLIDLSATGLTFADLTVSNTGSGDTLIGYDDGNASTPLDELTLTGISAAQITASDFVFV